MFVHSNMTRKSQCRRHVKAHVSFFAIFANCFVIFVALRIRPCLGSATTTSTSSPGSNDTDRGSHSSSSGALFAPTQFGGPPPPGETVAPIPVTPAPGVVGDPCPPCGSSAGATTSAPLLQFRSGPGQQEKTVSDSGIVGEEEMARKISGSSGANKDDDRAEPQLDSCCPKEGGSPGMTMLPCSCASCLRRLFRRKLDPEFYNLKTGARFQHYDLMLVKLLIGLPIRQEGDIGGSRQADLSSFDVYGRKRNTDWRIERDKLQRNIASFLFRGAAPKRVRISFLERSDLPICERMSETESFPLQFPRALCGQWCCSSSFFYPYALALALFSHLSRVLDGRGVLQSRM